MPTPPPRDMISVICDRVSMIPPRESRGDATT
jgi:hypothetical protein